MKKFLNLITIFGLIITFFTGCDSTTTINEALKNVNIEVDKIVHTDSFGEIIIAFYQDKESDHQMVGLFQKDKDNIDFIIQLDLQEDITMDEELTARAYLQDKTKALPEFSFQFGVIRNSQIKNVSLHMTDNTDFEDRYAKVIEIDGLRVWYSFIDAKRIFNIHQGISNEGEIIFSNSVN